MDWASFIMGVVPVHSLPTAGYRSEIKRGLGYNERPAVGTAVLAVCMMYILVLVGVQGKFSNVFHCAERVLKHRPSLSDHVDFSRVSSWPHRGTKDEDGSSGHSDLRASLCLHRIFAVHWSPCRRAGRCHYTTVSCSDTALYNFLWGRQAIAVSTSYNSFSVLFGENLMLMRI
jgi:hypothetical protein